MYDLVAVSTRHEILSRLTGSDARKFALLPTAHFRLDAAAHFGDMQGPKLFGDGHATIPTYIPENHVASAASPGSQGEPADAPNPQLHRLPMPEQDEWIPAREVCKAIPSYHGGSVCLRTFHRWRKAGKIQARKLGRWWFIRRSEYERLLQTFQQDVRQVETRTNRQARQKSVKESLRDKGFKV